MGAVPSTPCWGSRSRFAARPLETAEYLITTFISFAARPLCSLQPSNPIPLLPRSAPRNPETRFHSSLTRRKSRSLLLETLVGLWW
ncbi:hypothetical protein ACFX13_003586 [Malus domestica]